MDATKVRSLFVLQQRARCGLPLRRATFTAGEEVMSRSNYVQGMVEA